MADKIKNFFKKKKADATFTLAGPGHRMDQASASGPPPAAPSSGPRKPPSEAAAAAREAALRRYKSEEASKSSSKKPGPLDTLIDDEKRKYMNELKAKEAEEEAKTLARNKEHAKEGQIEPQVVEEEHRFSCPSLGITESLPVDRLREQIEVQIYTNFPEDALLCSVLMLKNCNFEQQGNQAISILEKILSNLMNSSPEEQDKFKRIRRSKIENKILNLVGGLQFLNSVGFYLDGEGEWFIFTSDAENISQQLEYYLDVLKNCELFPLELDREVVVGVPGGSSGQAEDVADEFFSLTSSELSREQQTLTEVREREETLMTKAMREQSLNRHQTNSKYTRLRIKRPDNSTVEATFKSSETISDVCEWLVNSSLTNGIVQFDLFCGREVIQRDCYTKSLNELKLSPAATLFLKRTD